MPGGPAGARVEEPPSPAPATAPSPTPERPLIPATIGAPLLRVQRLAGNAVATALAGRIMRHDDEELETFLTKLKDTSALTSLRGQLTEWDGADVERAARHFGIDRFQAMVFALGHQLIGQTTAAAMCLVDPKTPLALPVGTLTQRVAVAKRWAVPVPEFIGQFAAAVPAAQNNTMKTSEIMKLAREYGVAFPARFSAVLGHGAFNTDELRAEIELASQPDRDLVWQNKVLMADAKRRLSLDNYLGLLPLLRVFNAPATKIKGAQPGWDKHISSEDVDKHITTHLGHYVGKLVGRKAAGEISVVGDEDWELAFRRQWTTLDPTVVKPNAFVDVDLPKRQIWIHKDRGDSGTAIHEGMHKYASDNIRNIQRLKFPGKLPISQLDEGLTEYFTRLITPKLGITRTSYPEPFKFADRIVTLAGEATAAKAYFDGDLDALVTAYLVKSKRSLAQWELFAKALEEEKWPDAERIWTTGA